jgi:hypothetical protein
MVATPEAPGSRPDELVIAAADWLTRLGSSAIGLLSGEPGEMPEPVAAPGERASLALDDGDLREEGRVEQATFGAPLILGVASAIVVRYHQPFRRWASRHKAGPTARRPGAPSGPWRGPTRRP